MPQDKRKRTQPSKKRKAPKTVERTPQRARPSEPSEPAVSSKPDQPGQPGQPEPRVARRRPGEGLDKSDEGVIAGRRLTGRRFTG